MDPPPPLPLVVLVVLWLPVVNSEWPPVFSPVDPPHDTAATARRAR
jgi:hypothetical protein